MTQKVYKRKGKISYSLYQFADFYIGVSLFIDKEFIRNIVKGLDSVSNNSERLFLLAVCTMEE